MRNYKVDVGLNIGHFPKKIIVLLLSPLRKKETEIILIL